MADESYTKIPNELLNAFAIYKFNGRQRAIIDVICRYTFGFNRDYYKFPVALFETITGIKRHNVSAEISKLVAGKVINIIGSPTKTESRVYSINMNYQQWDIEKRETDTTIESDTITIENDTIENDTKLVLNPIVNYSQKQDKASIENDTHIIKDSNNNLNNKNLNKEIVDTAKALPTTPKFSNDSFEILVVETIIHSCLELYPNSKVPSTYKEKEKWALEVERMMRIDNRTEVEIGQALQFAVKDTFWKPNIRSTKKFREKFETLLIQSKKGTNGTKGMNKGQQIQDNFVDNMKGWLNDTAGVY